VGWVNYPGLPDHPQHALMQRQMRAGLGPAGLRRQGRAWNAGVKFIESAQFMSHLANIGDTRTLISHPASTTHRQLDAGAAARRRRAAGRAGAHGPT
jgi:O-acetylhomoserine (thiol)-lyase